jgi:uncharacterized protein
MAAGLPDRVDCTQLAEQGAVLERDYPLGDLPRLQDLLADKKGTAHAVFAFSRLVTGRAGVRVSIEATPHLVCQRCTKGTEIAVSSSSGIEFAGDEDADLVDPQDEIFVTLDGTVSLTELAEEELLLALPSVPRCATPEACGKSGALDGDRSRPFAGLQDMLKKTR